MGTGAGQGRAHQGGRGGRGGCAEPSTWCQGSCRGGWGGGLSFDIKARSPASSLLGTLPRYRVRGKCPLSQDSPSPPASTDHPSLLGSLSRPNSPTPWGAESPLPNAGGHSDLLAKGSLPLSVAVAPTPTPALGSAICTTGWWRDRATRPARATSATWRPRSAQPPPRACRTAPVPQGAQRSHDQGTKKEEKKKKQNHLSFY